MLRQDIGVLDSSNGRFCPDCAILKVPYTQVSTFDRLSPALALRLDRAVDSWHGGVNTCGKNFQHVSLPEELDMTPYIRLTESRTSTLAASGGRLLYRIMSLVEHIGATLRSGHYVAYTRSSFGGDNVEWMRWDDNVITPSSWAAVSLAPAYLVFYECVDTALLAALFPVPVAAEIV